MLYHISCIISYYYVSYTQSTLHSQRYNQSNSNSNSNNIIVTY